MAADLKDGYFEQKEPRRTKTGIRYYKIPENANEMLAWEEFNRFYMRALCRMAINDSIKLEVCRYKQVNDPKPESDEILGKSIDPDLLLKDLQNAVDNLEIMGVPAGHDSGLSLRLI